MKQFSIILLILQILCVTLSANAHSASLSHGQHEGVHYHFESEGEVDFVSSVFDGEHETHDPNTHTHLSIAILVSSENPALLLGKEPWLINLHTVYVSQTLSPPLPPPNT